MSLSGLKLSARTPQLCHTRETQKIQPKDNFYFPEFLHFPIRCALAADDDDLGVFITARLNIYFSAQGEARKKNVFLQDSASGGFNAISALLTFTRQVTSDSTQGIMGYIFRVCLAVCVNFVRSHTEVHCVLVWMLHRVWQASTFFITTLCFDPVPLF